MSLIAALLLATVPLATPEERLVQVHAATAVWLVDIDVRLYGEFIKEEDGERTGTDVVAKLGMWGTATAVSSDGYLLTNRHVVDPRYLVGVACKMKSKDYTKSVVQSARIDYAFLDLVGEPVRGVYMVAVNGQSDGLCADAMHAQYGIVKGSDAHLVALDENADLALVKLDVNGIPFIAPESRTLTNGDEVYSLGYDGRNQRLVRVTGVLVADCTGISEEESEDDIIFLPQPQPLMESTAPVRHGMSGGPVLNGTTLMGINVMSDSVCPDEGECTTVDVTSNAIPGYYAVAWYRWALGQDSDRPKLCTPQPKPVDETHTEFDPFAAVKRQ